MMRIFEPPRKESHSVRVKSMLMERKSLCHNTWHGVKKMPKTSEEIGASASKEKSAATSSYVV